MIVAGDMICFVVGNKLGSAGVSIKLSEKGSVKQTKLTQPRARTNRYACSPIPYYVELINSKLP